MLRVHAPEIYLEVPKMIKDGYCGPAAVQHIENAYIPSRARRQQRLAELLGYSDWAGTPVRNIRRHLKELKLYVGEHFDLKWPALVSLRSSLPHMMLTSIYDTRQLPGGGHYLLIAAVDKRGMWAADSSLGRVEYFSRKYITRHWADEDMNRDRFNRWVLIAGRQKA